MKITEEAEMEKVDRRRMVAGEKNHAFFSPPTPGLPRPFSSFACPTPFIVLVHAPKIRSFALRDCCLFDAARHPVRRRYVRLLLFRATSRNQKMSGMLNVIHMVQPPLLC